MHAPYPTTPRFEHVRQDPWSRFSQIPILSYPCFIVHADRYLNGFSPRPKILRVCPVSPAAAPAPQLQPGRQMYRPGHLEPVAAPPPGAQGRATGGPHHRRAAPIGQFGAVPCRHGRRRHRHRGRLRCVAIRRASRRRRYRAPTFLVLAHPHCPCPSLLLLLFLLLLLLLLFLLPLLLLPSGASMVVAPPTVGVGFVNRCLRLLPLYPAEHRRLRQRQPKRAKQRNLPHHKRCCHLC